MSHETAQNKSCNEVVFRRSSLTSRSRLTLRDQLLQSSITRVVSGADGSATIGAPDAAIANRPRLNAIESRSGSVDARSATSSFVARTRAGTVRDDEVVQTLIEGAAAAAPVRTIDTLRFDRSHLSCRRTTAVASTKSASLPPAMARYVQLPEIGCTVSILIWAGAWADACGTHGSADAAANANISFFICSGDRLFPGASQAPPAALPALFRKRSSLSCHRR